MKIICILIMILWGQSLWAQEDFLKLNSKSCYVDFSTKEVLYFENEQFLYSNGYKAFINLKTNRTLPSKNIEGGAQEGKHYICTFPNETQSYDIFLVPSINSPVLTCIGPDKKAQIFVYVGDIKQNLYSNLIQKYYSHHYQVIQTMKGNNVLDNSNEEIKLDLRGFWYNNGNGSWVLMQNMSGSFDKHLFNVKIPGDATIYPLQLTFYEQGIPAIIVKNPDGTEQIFGVK